MRAGVIRGSSTGEFQLFGVGVEFRSLVTRTVYPRGQKSYG